MIQKFRDMKIELPDDLLLKTGLNENGLLLSLSIELFREEKLTLFQAATVAGMDRLQFQVELAKRGIPPYYSEEQYENDLVLIQNLRL